MAAPQVVDRAAHRPPPPGARLTGRIGGRTERLAALLVASTLLAVWLVSGVSIGDIARFIAFEALYVLLPGCLLYLLLSPESGGGLRVVAIGWPLGYALEIGAFALTAALHVRGAFTLLPLLAALALGPWVVRRRSRARLGAARGNGAPGEVPPREIGAPRKVPPREIGAPGEVPPRERGWGAESLLGAAAISIALALLAFRYFAIYPLPEHASSVFYFLDNVEHLSLAAEALHHWPITEPFLAGHPFRYYTGVFIHVAAIKQVMGVPLAVGIFRLIPAMAILVAALQFWCLGGLLGRSRWAGPGTVALLIVIENLKLYPTHTKVFGVALFSEFTVSPTYGFGVIFLLGLLILFRLRLLAMTVTRASPRSAPAALPPSPGAPARAAAVDPTPSGVAGSLVMLGILVLGGSAVKTTAVATFVGGLGLLWLWRLGRGQLERLLSYCLITSLVCFVLMYRLLLAGSSGPASTETELAPLNFMKYTVLGSTLASHPGLVPLLGGAVVMFLWKLLPVVGAVWPAWRRGIASTYIPLALAVFVVGFVVYVLLGSPNDNETYFIWYGYIAIIPLATASALALWSEAPGDVRRAIPSACAVVVVLGLLLAGATQVLRASGTLTGARGTTWYLWYGGTLALAGGVVVLWSLRLEWGLAPWVALRSARFALCGVLLLGALGWAQSLVLAVPQTWSTLLDRQAVPRDSPSRPGMTAALYRGLVWVRAHTGRCDVLAANTHAVRVAGTAGSAPDSGYFYYSAFTERRVILESWVLTTKGEHGEQPYPVLYALNREATLRGNPAAVRELARRGVGYILIDKTHGGGVRESSDVSRLVFSNSALAVYRVTAPVGAHGC
jgi:hypothetical protein